MKKIFTAYTDGSFNRSRNTYGYAAVLIGPDKKEYAYSASGSSQSKYWNVAGEIEAAKLAVEKAKELGAEQLTICHDYEGVGKWPTGAWKAKNPYTKEYVRYIKKCDLKITFRHVKGHSGNKYNEMADSLATAAAGGRNISLPETTYEEKLKPQNKSGQIKELCEKYKTTETCMRNIIVFKSKDKRVFKDYMRLKVGGKDSWSKMLLEELLVGAPDEMIDAMEAEGLTERDAASALRWFHRGLKWEDAVKKVLVDLEVRENCR